MTQRMRRADRRAVDIEMTQYEGRRQVGRRRMFGRGVIENRVTQRRPANSLRSSPGDGCANRQARIGGRIGICRILRGCAARAA